MATQQPQKLLQTPAGLSLLQKVLNGQKPGQEEMAVAQQMAQNAAHQQQTQHSQDPDSKNA